MHLPFTARFRCLASVLILAIVCAALSAHGQSRVPSSPTPTPAPGSDIGAPPPLFASPNPTDPNQVHMLHAMAKERNTIRQKEIIDDTNHLLDLARQLKDAVNKSDKDQLSLSVVDTAAEIEKLAKSVKEKMRDGQ
jgi:hypothetical protein